MNRIGDEEALMKGNQQDLREHIERTETALQQYRAKLTHGEIKLQKLEREFAMLIGRVRDSPVGTSKIPPPTLDTALQVPVDTTIPPAQIDTSQAEVGANVVGNQGSPGQKNKARLVPMYSCLHRNYLTAVYTSGVPMGIACRIGDCRTNAKRNGLPCFFEDVRGLHHHVVTSYIERREVSVEQPLGVGRSCARPEDAAQELSVIYREQNNSQHLNTFYFIDAEQAASQRARSAACARKLIEMARQMAATHPEEAAVMKTFLDGLPRESSLRSLPWKAIDRSPRRSSSHLSRVEHVYEEASPSSGARPQKRLCLTDG